MKRRHLAIFTQMGNGHVYPVLPLCAELVARGYRVTCPANDRYSNDVRSVGAEAVVFAATPVDEALRAENERRSRVPMNDSSRFETTELEWSHFLKSNDDLVAQIGGFYADNVPDLILYNRYCIAGRIVAHRFHCRAVQLSPHFAYRGRSRFWDRGVSTNPAGLIAYAEKLDSYLADHGLTSDGNLWHVEPLNIHFLPKEFQYRGELFDQRFLFVGSHLQRSFQPRWRNGSRNGAACQPLVLISGYSGLPETCSSDLRYFKVFIDALANSACRCVLSIGDSVAAHSIGPLPTNFEVNRDASHLEILPHAALFACHAGMGSTLEAIYNAVPVLAVPGTPYTAEVGYRVAELRLGTLLPRNVLSVESVRETVAQMLGDMELLERAREMQQVFRRSAGAAAAADMIERFLE